jgi:hypothetical protein
MPTGRPAVDIVIADTGPLISLATAHRLDLLHCFGRPVKVLDVVKEECLRKEGAPGQAELKLWFESNAPAFELVNSPLLQTYRQALAREASGEDPHATEGLGDAAISWLVAKAPRLYGRDTISLVLTEDAPFGDTRLGRNVHVLATRPFLATLENLGMIESARAIIADIAAAGRNVSRYGADRPAEVGPRRRRSQWDDSVEKAKGPGL